jgi:hypothetical protein
VEENVYFELEKDERLSRKRRGLKERSKEHVRKKESTLKRFI